MLDLASQRRLDPEQRMVRHVQPEHLLLVAQLVDLVELDVGDRHALVEPGRLGSVVTAPVTEQAHHALVPFATAGQRRVDDVLEDPEQTLAGVAEVVEGTGLDQRLDGSLVEHGLGNAFGEIVEADERAVGVALGEQQGDRVHRRRCGPPTART